MRSLRRTIFYCSSGKRRSGNRSGQYFCKRNHYAYCDELGGCKQPNLRQPEVDGLIEAFAIQMLTKADTLTQIIDQSLQHTREVVYPFPQQTSDSQLAALKQKDKRLLDAYEGGAMTLDELRSRRNAIKAQIASLQRRVADQKDQGDISTEELVRKVVRGAFRFKRMTDRKEKKAIILALFSEIYVKDRSIIAFKLRDDLHASGADKLGAGFSTPPIHLATHSHSHLSIQCLRGCDGAHHARTYSRRKNFIRAKANAVAASRLRHTSPIWADVARQPPRANP